MSGTMIKIKQEDYVNLHKLVFGMNERTVWEMLGEGQTVSEICEPLPDEFHAWVEDVAGRLLGRHTAILDYVSMMFGLVQVRLGEGASRKDFAVYVNEHAPRSAPYLFAMLDGKDVAPMIWKSLKPSGESKLRAMSTEDV
jgi:RNA ligase